MVTFINNKNIDFLANMIYGYFAIQGRVTYIADINKQKEPCIYALWHGHMLSLYSMENRKNINIMVSNSKDGEIITKAIEKMGYSTVRGSSARKGCVSAMMQLITKLKNGESAAIMIDGPNGPLHKIKCGIITLAKETGLPIIPLYWYSAKKNLLTLPSWDKMTFPLFPIHIINLYGDPIYVNKDDDTGEIKDKIAKSLEYLEQIAPKEYERAKKEKLWKKKK